MNTSVRNLSLIKRYIIFFTYLMIPLSIIGPGFIILPKIGPITLLPHWLFMTVSIPASFFLLMINGFKIRLVSVVRIDKYIKFLLLWIVFGYISLLWASNRELGLRDMVLFSLLIGYIILIMFSWSSLGNVKIAMALLYFILIVNFCVVFVEIMYDYHLPAAGISITGMAMERPSDYEPGLNVIFMKGVASGTFYNANGLSIFVSIVLPIIFSFYVRSPVQKMYLRILSFIVVVIGIVLLFYTFTRTVYFALFCAVIYYVLISRNRKVIILIFLSAIILFHRSLVTNIYELVFNISQFDQSAELRAMFAKTVINDLFASFLLLGKGPAAYPFAIHNWYLEIAGLFGVYIFALYIIFIFAILKNLYAIYKKTHSVELRYLSEGLLGSNITYSISCIADSGRLIGYDSWIIIAASLVIINLYRSGNDKTNDSIAICGSGKNRGPCLKLGVV